MRRKDEHVDPLKADRLDRELDGLSAPLGYPSPAHLDDGLFRFSGEVQSLDVHDLEPEPNAAFVQRLEEDLMLHARDLHPSYDPLTRVAKPMSERWTDWARPASPPTRSVSTWRPRPLLWLASAALLALIATSALIVYFAAQGSGNDEPTLLSALQSDTPEPGVSGAVTPLVTACDVEPRTLEEVISLLQWEPANQPPYVPPSVVLAAPPNTPIVLPDGTVPTEVEIASVSATYGELWGCIFERDKLRQLALRSDDGVIRNYYTDGIPHIGNIAYLGSTDVEQEWEGRADIGEATPHSLYGLRKLSDGRIAAFVAPTEPTIFVDGTPSSNSGFGYIVFVDFDGRWLIDESFYVAG